MALLPAEMGQMSQLLALLDQDLGHAWCSRLRWYLNLEPSYRLQIDDRLRPCGSPTPPKVTDWLPTRCRSATSWKLCAGSRPGAGAGSVFAQAVDLGCHDEVVFVQAVDLLGP